MKSKGTQDKEKVTKFYYQNLQSINKWIKAADNKANFLVALYSVILASLFVQIGDYIKIVKDFNCGIVLILISFFLLLTIVFIGKSFWHFYRVIHPRIKSKEYIKDGPTSNIFWNDIAMREFGEFRASVGKIDDESFLIDVLSQVYINSKICDKKFKNVKAAYNLILPTLISTINFTIILKIGG